MENVNPCDGPPGAELLGPAEKRTYFEVSGICLLGNISRWAVKLDFHPTRKFYADLSKGI
jgi:hypothetical protein